MATFKWDHIHLRSPDPEATAAFYERMFGAEVIRTMQQGKTRIDLKIGGASVFIAPVTAGDGVASPPKTPTRSRRSLARRCSGWPTRASNPT